MHYSSLFHYCFLIYYGLYSSCVCILYIIFMHVRKYVCVFLTVYTDHAFTHTLIILLHLHWYCHTLEAILLTNKNWYLQVLFFTIVQWNKYLSLILIKTDLRISWLIIVCIVIDINTLPLVGFYYIIKVIHLPILSAKIVCIMQILFKMLKLRLL